METSETNPDPDTEPDFTSLWKWVFGDQYAVKTSSMSKIWDPETGTYIIAVSTSRESRSPHDC